MKTTVKTSIQDSPSDSRFNAVRNIMGNLTQAFGEKLRRKHEAWLRRNRTNSVNAAIGTPA